jgi:two-component system response regulator VanR
MDPNNYEVYLGGTCLALTPTEFRLLHLLAKNRPRFLTHDTLDQALWENRRGPGINGLAKKYVQRLRIKLGDDARHPRWIASVYDVGYRFVGPTEGQQLFSDQPC